VLQCIAMCCGVLRAHYGMYVKPVMKYRARAAMCCNVLQCVAMCCNVLQCVVMCCNVLQCVAIRCNVLQCVAVCCNVLQCVEGTLWDVCKASDEM